MAMFRLSTSRAVTSAPGRAQHGWSYLLRAAAVAGACLAAALLATWPLLIYPTGAIPLGTEHETTVPIFSLWSLWWVAERAMHGFAGLWEAPFFYPNRGVLTYSEPQLLGGLLSTPLWAVGAPPALIYNLVLLVFLTLNGGFAYRLARALAVPRLSAVLAGILTVTLPFLAKVSGVLPLVGLFGMLWTLEGLVRFGRHGSRRWAIWSATGLLLTFLTCQQYFLMFAPFALAALVLALVQQRFHRRSLAAISSAWLSAGGVIVLLALPALEMRAERGFRRAEPVVAALSARPGDFLTRPEQAWASLPARDPADTAGLFPGALLLLLALAGLPIGLRAAQPGRRGWSIYLAVAVLGAFLLALGLNLSLGGWRPFASLRQLVPGLDQLRTPYRFAALVQLQLPILAALALARLQQSSRAGVAVALTLALFAGIENLAVPTPLAAVPASPRADWTAWLRSQPAGTVVAHVPLPAGLHVVDYEIEAWRLFAQIDHQQPIVNGYSSYFPQNVAPDGTVIPTYTQFQLAMAELFPDARLLCVLDQGLQVDLLVADRDWLAGQRQSALEAQQSFLQPAYADEHVQIFRLQAPPGACRTR